MFSAQLISGKAVLRFDVVGGPERERIVEDASFMAEQLEILRDHILQDDALQDRSQSSAP